MTIEAIIVSTVDLSGLVWRKSSRSGQDHTNGACVEIAWHKSSRSGQDGSNGNCVEVAFTRPVIAIRDSKSPANGALAFSGPGWAAFLHVAKL